MYYHVLPSFSAWLFSPAICCRNKMFVISSFQALNRNFSATRFSCIPAKQQYLALFRQSHFGRALSSCCFDVFTLMSAGPSATSLAPNSPLSVATRPTDKIKGRHTPSWERVITLTRTAAARVQPGDDDDEPKRRRALRVNLGSEFRGVGSF